MGCQAYVLVFLSCVGLGNAQLLVQPTMSEETITKKFQVGKEHVEVSLTISEPKLCDTSVKSYSGYFQTASSASASDGRKLFFWFFESRSAPSTDPVVLWLTGGPGCSSMLATLAENGPCSISADGNVVHNPNSWNNKANVLWVDQPAGTGFSVGSNPGHMYESIVGDQMYGFLQAFFQHFSQYQNLDFFVTGESYGGHYVPTVSHRVWQGNEKKEGLKINLKGLAVGNGLTDPLEQYKWYPEMAHDGGKSEGGTAPGVITDEATYNKMKSQVQPCIDKIAKCTSENTYSECVEAQAFCNNAFIGPYSATGMNVYDQRIKCEVPGLCYNFSAPTKWLNSPDVQKQLGVSKTWESCNYAVNGQFQGDWMLPYDTKLVDLLAAGIRVLIYAGDCDFICNWLGNKHWTLKLQWPHNSEFNAAQDKPYMANGKEVGRLRTANGFSFMQVYQAGHMVPMDQPEVSLQMLNQFVDDKLESSSKPVDHEVVV